MRTLLKIAFLLFVCFAFPYLIIETAVFWFFGETLLMWACIAGIAILIPVTRLVTLYFDRKELEKVLS